MTRHDLNAADWTEKQVLADSDSNFVGSDIEFVTGKWLWKLFLATASFWNRLVRSCCEWELARRANCLIAQQQFSKLQSLGLPVANDSSQLIVAKQYFFNASASICCICVINTDPIKDCLHWCQFWRNLMNVHTGAICHWDGFAKFSKPLLRIAQSESN